MLARRHPTQPRSPTSDATVANVARGAGRREHGARRRARAVSGTTTRCSAASSSPTATSRSTTWSASSACPQRHRASSCESGLSAVHAGDELMGFTAAVFALGTSTVIAAVVPVPDEATKGLMLRAGRSSCDRAATRHERW